LAAAAIWEKTLTSKIIRRPSLTSSSRSILKKP
jgi:hypothetical protein